MREINFSSMCHIFVISRGLPGHSLLNCLLTKFDFFRKKKSRFVVGLRTSKQVSFYVILPKYKDKT